MKKILALAAAAIFAVTALTSCLPNSGIIMSNNIALADWKDGILYTDDGYEYTIVENQTLPIPASASKVYITCDVLTKLSETKYEIRLKDWQIVHVKEILQKSQPGTVYLNDKGELFTNPISLYHGWFSNGNLNLIVNYLVKRDSKTTHDFDLIYDDIKSNSDTLYLKLYHNAHGEFLGEGGLTEGTIYTGTNYASFPFSHLMPAGKESVYVKMEWEWHPTIQGAFQKETQLYYGVTEVKK